MSEEIYRYLCCPDDNANLNPQDYSFECQKCHRQFHRYRDNLIELLPSQFPEWNLADDENKKIERSYENLFHEKFTWNSKAKGWGDLSKASPGYRAFVRLEVEKIRELLNPSHSEIAVDVSGGIGNYSIPLAKSMKALIHCELDVASIAGAYTAGKGSDNIFYVRSPYIKLPLKSSVFDYAICTDTLVRGWNHEITLLKEIYRILKDEGKAVLDFHNPRFFSKNEAICFYSKARIRKLLVEAGIQQYSIYPFGYVPVRIVPHETIYTSLNTISKFLVPCTRYIVVVIKRG